MNKEESDVLSRCTNVVSDTNDLSQIESLELVNKWFEESIHLPIGGRDGQIYKAWKELRKSLMNYQKAILYDLYDKYGEDMLQSIDD